MQFDSEIESYRVALLNTAQLPTFPLFQNKVTYRMTSQHTLFSDTARLAQWEITVIQKRELSSFVQFDNELEPYRAL